MKIVEFLKSTPNWKEQLSEKPYALKIKEKNNLILFNYSQIDSDPANEIVAECRGLVLEKDTWKVVRFGFKRFFNLGERYAANIDWKSATASTKEDGTLIFVYYYNGWHVGTRSNIDAEDALLGVAQFKTFRTLFDYVSAQYNFSFEDLNKNYTYVMELCSLYNQIVVSYSEPKLFHLTTVDNITLEEINTNIGVPKPKFYSLNSKEEYEELVNSLPENTEGIVVRDIFGNRVKIKTKLYFELHRLVNNGHLDVERALGLVMENDYEELLAYYPSYTNFFEEVKTAYNNALDYIDFVKDWVYDWKTRYPFASRKLFALEVKTKPIPALYFLAYEQRLDNYGETLDARKFLSIFRNYFKEIKE